MRTPIETETFGDPNLPAIFLVPGWAMPKEVFHETATKLSQHFYVVLANLPGVSVDPNWHKRNRFGPNYDIDALAEQLLRAAPKPCWWIGWSLGGMIANYVAARRSSCVKGVISVASAPCFTAIDEWPIGMEPDAFTHFFDLVKQTPEKGFRRFLTLQTQGASDAKGLTKTLSSLQPKELIDPEALIRGLALLETLDVRREIELLDVPNLHMFGAQDALVDTEKVIQWLPKNYLQTVLALPNQAHQPFLEDPSQFVATVTQYINDNTFN
ncbi:Pimeloyl-[acyl-carrier protein] methyl ester esterase [Marinomonas gallaica]|uniref:Pimeloyl-[acyl-carrier protein] methyl ester esterase n=1 Tax=Marinomonas gallaica TaxID=1806667 RepID=A0A1C3JM04_9GAMM|nr:alpha/beta fold hydrolase [Marinomonas gallaica]SBT16248.1 Pimeloyl-[acyl-carrier protein] methyl ester esterase [Marinomonas gallaica]SBT21296.1 Pimeloyl-[acyl-carrier protein] methyl ester esterase [Marinomonas gallaica]